MQLLKKLKYRFSHERRLNQALKQVFCKAMLHRSDSAFLQDFARQQGICANVILEMGNSYSKKTTKRIHKLMAAWPLNETGGYYYPVGGIEQYRVEEKEGILWHNPRRVQLLQWMIEQTEYKP